MCRTQLCFSALTHNPYLRPQPPKARWGCILVGSVLHRDPSTCKRGIAMDPDLNKYDVEHVCTAHSRMTGKEWQDIYHEAWLLYYTPAHMKTLLRRAKATGVPLGNLAKYLLTFSMTDRLEHVHPL